MYFADVSVVIPSIDELDSLEKSLVALAAQSVPPNEVVVVISGAPKFGVMQSVADRFPNMPLRFIERHALCFPGEARNIGVAASRCEQIGFLDVKTLPTSSWLEESIELLKLNSGFDIVFGNTVFHGEGALSLTMRDVIFGRAPHKSVPGTLIRKSAFAETGGFLEHVRCGEDAVWFQKISRMGLKALERKAPTTRYIGLTCISFGDLFSKWWSRYFQSGKLAVYFYQQIASVSFMCALSLIIAYNWNSYMSGWSEESLFYLPHVSKVVFCLLSFCYLVFRGAIVPLSRGVPSHEVWPLRWAVMGGLALSLDIIKALALTVSFVDAKIRRVIKLGSN